MKQITSTAQIKNLPQKHIYVRWSKSIALDNRRGYSLRYGRDREAGLSACEINKDWEDWRIIRQLQEYVFLGGTCWLVTGDEIGLGGDNEPLLCNIEPIGKVSQKLLMLDWHRLYDEKVLAELVDRLSRMTDAIAIKLTKEEIAKLQSKLATA